LIYQLVLAFFGLTPSYKNILLEEIHTLCYFGQGGFTHDEAYNMPIRYRHYHLKKIAEYIDKQNEIRNPQPGVSDGAKKQRDPLPIPDFATKANKSKAPKK